MNHSDYKILQGDCLTTLKSLDDCSVNTCVTSPPYWGLRDYGTGRWEGGDPDCSHKRDSKYSESCSTGQKNLKGAIGDGIYKKICKRCGARRIDNQLGLELTPEEFVKNMVGVFREVHRILKDDGTLWLNLGDTYTSIAPPKEGGLPEKNLVGIPWRVAFALQEDGWYLRQDIIWSKPNPMPESVTDRCTKAHEYIFLLSKSRKYYFDNEAIKEPAHTTDKSNRNRDDTKLNNTPGRTRMAGLKTNHYTTKNKRSVWNVSTKPYKGAHFATFPSDLIKPCILAGCPEGGTVLDPFGGSGTTAQVSLQNNRNAILCELNDDYIKLAEERIKKNTAQLQLL